jgi:carboxyvinyl-carboxyphosphonate phosphorylmutase
MKGFLSPPGNSAVGLRPLISQPEPILAPGAYDALTARLVEQAGFPAVYMTGFGTAAALLGRPDIGLVTMSQMVDNARRIAQAVDVPVIADADTGYGNAINVVQTVREYERAGVAGIHIEDQVAPKRCGHMEGKQVIDSGEMVEKIRAALEARSSPDFVIIARTDARAVEGMDGALRRGRLYRDAGADMLFVEAPQGEDEVAAVARAFPDTPLFFNWLEGGKTPPIPLARLKELGFRVIIFPLSTLLTVTRAVRNLLSLIREDGTPERASVQMVSFQDFLQVVGLPEVREWEKRLANSRMTRG